MTLQEARTKVSGRLLISRWTERLFKGAAVTAILLALGILAYFLVNVFLDSLPRLSWDFLTSFPSRRPQAAGIAAALVGSAFLILLTALFALPLGIGAALYLEEYAPKTWWTKLIEINIANLAGVPSIIYGILGLGLFVRALQLERSLIAGALTMALLVLPILIISAREAIRTVPGSIREASYALGATRWHTIAHQVLPLALPGILTGTILAFSRAIGETAPLIMIGALTYVAFIPDGLFSPFTALPIQIFNWTSRPQKGFLVDAAAGIIVLLAVLLALNAVAIYLRYRYQRKTTW
ncbi:MAG: phosphate ABC transporter permease PstA [Nitrospirae bacterium]|nr:phosphate ABC transporter permease PstA [Nitrospirota bacterium]